MKHLIIGDLHLKEKLGYSEFVSDGRLKEKNNILDFIVKASKGCDRVIFLGDQLNGRNNPSVVIKEFVSFIERIKSEVVILAGNHEKKGDGKSALDFMKEIKGKKWHIVTNEIKVIDNDVFCPYFFRGELEAENNDIASDILTKKLLSDEYAGKNLFIHHAVSDFKIRNKEEKFDKRLLDTGALNEIVIYRKEISSHFSMIFCGHIHTPFSEGNFTYTGSVFSNEMNEGSKYIYTLEDDKLEKIKLPGRKIIKLDDPSIEKIKECDKDSIVRVILTTKPSEEKEAEIKELLSSFAGSMLVEDFKVERKIVNFSDGELDLDIENLMRIYSEERKVDLKKLKDGYNLINN